MGIRIGIVGAGTTVAIADRHVEGFLAQAGRCTVTAVCSRTLEGCRRLCIRHGLDGVRMTTRLEELLDVVDAVVLCTPNQFHLPYTERAVERGKAVLLEKPLGLQTAPPGQAERLLARRDARVMVAYVYRYTAVVERLRALLRQRMGRVYLAQASQGGTRLADPAVPLEWRMRRSASGSGALGDFGSHLLDLLQYAAGVELAEAAGYGGTFLPTRRPDGQGNTCVENDDAFVFCGRGTGGALCSVSVSRVGLDGIHLCISGEGGLLRASVEEGVLTYWPKAPDGPYAPEGEARSEHLAEPPGLRFARQAAAFLDPHAAEVRRHGDSLISASALPAVARTGPPPEPGCPAPGCGLRTAGQTPPPAGPLSPAAPPGASPPAPRWRKDRRFRGTGRAPVWP